MAVEAAVGAAVYRGSVGLLQGFYRGYVPRTNMYNLSKALAM